MSMFSYRLIGPNVLGKAKQNHLRLNLYHTMIRSATCALVTSAPTEMSMRNTITPMPSPMTSQRYWVRPHPYLPQRHTLCSRPNPFKAAVTSWSSTHATISLLRDYLFRILSA